ncbi:pilus assembly protein TadG-related protein [Actinacidiphila bryophytorum]|nr:pilus assembly protein TadG-related protein [Actinacidiphila bryophytorum]
MAMSALFFLAFAYFAVGQAAVSRNGTQTAADSAALAAARASRDQLHDDMLAALISGDESALQAILQRSGTDLRAACGQAYAFASANGAKVDGCDPVTGTPPGFKVRVTSRSSVGSSVVKDSENVYASAEATAVVEPRCAVDGLQGVLVQLTCDHHRVTVDPTAAGFVLDLSTFYAVHLSK